MITIHYYPSKQNRKNTIDSLTDSRVLHDDFVDITNLPTDGNSGRLTIVSGLDDPNNTIIPSPKEKLTEQDFIKQLAKQAGIELI